MPNGTGRAGAKGTRCEHEGERQGADERRCELPGPADAQRANRGRLRRSEDGAGWQDVPLRYSHTDVCGNCRGLGVSETAHAIREGRQPRLSGELAYHVLDVMESILESSSSGRQVEVQSSCRRPPLLPLETGLEVAT